MKLTEIQEAWAKDCRIDETNLGHASAQVPMLHSKYLNLLTNSRLQLRKSESDLARLRRTKYRYYRGELSKEELTELGWEQWQGVKPIKNEMDEFLATDDDLIAQTDRVEYFKTVYQQLESILKSISSRTWDIKSSIEWYKFSNGM
jgi:hypothetical protein